METDNHYKNVVKIFIRLIICIPFRKIHKMKRGKVKFNNRFKGYGIIKEKETGEEFQMSPFGIKETIKDGDDVTFETTEGRTGLSAIEIRLDTFKNDFNDSQKQKVSK